MQRSNKKHAPRVVAARSRLAQLHRRQRIVFFVLVCVFVIFLFGFISWVSYRERFAISEVRVVGAAEVSRNEIVAVVEGELSKGRFHILSPRNVLFYPRTEIESHLLAGIPMLRNATVRLSSLPGRVLVVSVRERVTYGIWCHDTQDSAGEVSCFRLDDEGFVFAPADAFAEYPRFFGSLSGAGGVEIGRYFLQGEFARVPTLIAALSAAGYDTFSLTALPEGDVEIQLVGVGAMRLRANLSQSVDEIVGNLQTALASDALAGRASEIEYIDLRFGNRVYFKLKGGE